MKTKRTRRTELPALPDGVNEDDTRPSKKKKAASSMSECDRPRVIVSDGLRHVVPYTFEYRTYAKKRWFGRTIGEVFMNEFQTHTPEYYKQAILDGHMTVRGRTVPLDYVLADGDWVCCRSHRHEPPILDLPIDVIDETDELLVVNKPPSMPVHATGSYRENSLLRALEETHDCPLFVVNRLDRLTSGLMILAKSSTVAAELARKFREREIAKTYLARVKGEFPSGDIVVDEPLMCASRKIGSHKVDPKGKPSKTLFTRLSFNGRTSVVQCKPVTGRTHQIRVHLQHLGHPIANDPCYGGVIMTETTVSDDQGDGHHWRSELEAAVRESAVPWCPHCTRLAPGSTAAARSSRDYAYRIWLHALRYESIGVSAVATAATVVAEAQPKLTSSVSSSSSSSSSSGSSSLEPHSSNDDDPDRSSRLESQGSSSCADDSKHSCANRGSSSSDVDVSNSNVFDSRNFSCGSSSCDCSSSAASSSASSRSRRSRIGVATSSRNPSRDSSNIRVGALPESKAAAASAARDVSSGSNNRDVTTSSNSCVALQGSGRAVGDSQNGNDITSLGKPTCSVASKEQQQHSEEGRLCTRGGSGVRVTAAPGSGLLQHLSFASAPPDWAAADFPGDEFVEKC